MSVTMPRRLLWIHQPLGICLLQIYDKKSGPMPRLGEAISGGSTPNPPAERRVADYLSHGQTLGRRRSLVEIRHNGIEWLCSAADMVA